MFSAWLIRRRPDFAETLLILMTGAVLGLNTPGTALVGVVVGAWIFAAACLRIGQQMEAWSGMRWPVEFRFLVGLVLLGYAVALPVRLLGWPIVVPAGAFLFAACLPLRTPRTGDRALTLAGIATAAAFAAVWSMETSRRLAHLKTDGVLRLWSDYFIHAGAIAEFGDVRAFGRESIALADVPPDIYHFVSFALPGLAVRAGLSPMESIGYVWIPLGILATALGVFTLGRALGGAGCGVLAVILLAATPDTASFGLHQGFLSFHWMLEAAPGTLYALPCACASLAMAIAWCRDGDLRALAVSALLVAATFLLRAHVMIWFIGPWAFTCLACARSVPSRWRIALLTLGAMSTVLALLWVGRDQVARVGLTHYLTQFIEFLHLQNDPTAYGGEYRAMVERWGSLGALGPGVVLALIGMGGLPLAGTLVGAAVAGVRRRFELWDLFPFASLAWAVLLMLLAPSPFNGDVTEFRQRGFPVVTAILLVWCARWAAHVGPDLLAFRRGPNWAPWIGGIAATSVAWFAVPTWKVPRMGWAQSFVHTPVAAGLADSAAWLRTEAPQAAAFTMDTSDPRAIILDDATILAGLSGVPAWLSRAGLQTQAGGARGTAARDREAALERAAAAPDRDTAFSALRKAKVDFYIVASPPRWDALLAGASFRAQEYAVYRTGAGR